MAFCQCGHGTHVGNIRADNEDNYAINVETCFGVLADGMGGHDAGEVASKIAVDSISADISNGKLMVDALVDAHRTVLEAASNGKGRKGMGSTAVAIKLNAKKFEIVWLGDSRAYCWNGQQLTQVSKDHSLVQTMVDDGLITAEKASSHPRRNYLTQSLGMPEMHSMKVGHAMGYLYRNYQFLLCSDGLSDEVTNAEITEVLKLEVSEQQKADLLIQKAVNNGGSDNITVILFSAPDSAPESTPETTPAK
jgi:protein phosphatase